MAKNNNGSKDFNKNDGIISYRNKQKEGKMISSLTNSIQKKI
jgi:hypothetical protein